MYKVVLVDDEAIIVQGLEKTIPWQDYNCKVVGRAHDVKSGLAVIKEHAPNILFTDIRMPDGSGLSMLAGLRSEHPNMEVTVLTGYKDFDYARKAITLGVTRFLLKPSKMSELIEAVEAMTEKLNNSAKPPEEEPDQEHVSSFVTREAIEYIQNNFNKRINLSDVAEACYVSQWHLSKLLSKNAGQSFYDILNTSRINAAKRLLENPALRIGEIAEKVGYTDTPHFSRVFKKLEGLSPNDYRNSKL